MPKLLLPTFSGDILEWQEFFESFSVAVDRQSIADIEKFQYLKANLKGDAASILTGLPMTSNNYKIAIDLLKSRFGSTNTVIRAHLRALLSLNKPKIKSACSIHLFFDSVICVG